MVLGKRIFLDTSVLITALLSARGASFYLLVEHRSTFRFFINDYVLQETIGVLRRKFLKKKLASPLHLLLGFARVDVLPNPSLHNLELLRGVVEEEDTPILASALAHCDVVLMLDHGFFTPTAQERCSGRIAIHTPASFLQEIRG